MLCAKFSRRKIPPSDFSSERATASAIEADMGVPQKEFRDLIPSVAVEKATLFNPTRLGERLVSVTAPAEVNKLLERLGFQERLNKEWKLTEKGAQYGENRPYERNKHNAFQILWRESVIPVLQSASKNLENQSTQN